MSERILSKDLLIRQLKDISQQGYILGTHQGNNGNVGNTLESLLGIKENNLPIPNYAEWEIKASASNTLITLFHREPSPMALRFVTTVLLPKFGWLHKEAGLRHPSDEMSFRLTISATRITDRGFGLRLNKDIRKLSVIFDSSKTNSRHQEWLHSVLGRNGSLNLDIEPYWSIDDLYRELKLHNCFFVFAKKKKINGFDYFHYQKVIIAKNLTVENLMQCIDLGLVQVDFDARTRKNHGVKFRIKEKAIINLYNDIVEIELG
jgi:hypothetical protein